MQFSRTTLRDAVVVKTDKHEDSRGYFARARCAKEFAEAGLPAEFVQTNLSHNTAANTFRGLHFQVPPSREGKLVRCVVGAIDDVIVDLRPDSETFLQHEWVHLSAENLCALFIPSGFAHGFLTAADETLVLYEMTDMFAPELARGIRWSDPSLKIRLPREVQIINDRDAGYPDLNPEDLSVFAQSGS